MDIKSGSNLPTQAQNQPLRNDNLGYGIPSIIPQQPLLVKEESLEVQKWMTDIEWMREKVFYPKFSGWTEKRITSTDDNFGLNTQEIMIRTEVELTKRDMNERGADYLLSILEPIISPPATTSTSTDDDLYTMFDGITTVAILHLCRDAMSSNHYEFKMESIDDVVAFICSFKIIAQKSKGALTIKEWRSSYSTANQNGLSFQVPMPQPRQKFLGIF